MSPPYERLCSYHPPGAHNDLGLILHQKFAPVKRLAQMLSNRNPLDGADIDLRVIELKGVPAPLFCMVHGDIRIPEQRGYIFAVIGIDADADTGRYLEMISRDSKGFFKRFHDFPGDGRDVFRADDIREHDVEFIAADAGRRV